MLAMSHLSLIFDYKKSWQPGVLQTSAGHSFPVKPSLTSWFLLITQSNLISIDKETVTMYLHLSTIHLSHVLWCWSEHIMSVIQFNAHHQTARGRYCCSPISWRVQHCTEGLNNFLEPTWLVDGRAWVWIREVWIYVLKPLHLQYVQSTLPPKPA